MLTLKKNGSVKIMQSFNGFLSLQVNILGIQSVLFSWHAILIEHKLVLWTFFMEYTIKMVREVNSTDQTI